MQAGPYSTMMRSISACILAARSWGVEQAASRSALAAAMMSCRMMIPFRRAADAASGVLASA
jgi:hypothetical protein